MRLGAVPLRDLHSIFGQQDFAVLGCLSFEPRCRAAVEEIVRLGNSGLVLMVDIEGPADGFPDYRPQIRARIEKNKASMRANGVDFTEVRAELLASEDFLLNLVDLLIARASGQIVLDITCFPRRFFCLMVKRLLASNGVRSLIVTYGEVPQGGYSEGHLAEDPMSCDFLPGFSGGFPSKGNTVVIGAGFEALGMNSFLEIYRDGQRDMKVIFAFPPNGSATRRQWNTLRQLTSGRPREVRRENIEIVAAWDVEYVYGILKQWDADCEGLTLAPFGPKPHTLGMALFAIERDAALYYSQPKSYNPEYSQGAGRIWAYLLKWEGASVI